MNLCRLVCSQMLYLLLLPLKNSKSGGGGTGQSGIFSHMTELCISRDQFEDSCISIGDIASAQQELYSCCRLFLSVLELASFPGLHSSLVPRPSLQPHSQAFTPASFPGLHSSLIPRPSLQPHSQAFTPAFAACSTKNLPDSCCRWQIHSCLKTDSH